MRRKVSRKISRVNTPKETIDSNDSMSDSPKSQRKDTIKRVYGINKRKSIIGAFISRKSIAESKGAKILDGACTGCGSVLDLETIEEHVPAKAMMKKFETLMLGR